MQAEDICRGYGTDDWGPATQWKAITLLGCLLRCKWGLLDEKDLQLAWTLDELCLKKIPTTTIPALLDYPDLGRWAFQLGVAHATGKKYESGFKYEGVLFDLFRFLDNAGLLLWYATKRRASDTSLAAYRTQMAKADRLFDGRAGMWCIIEERLRTWHLTIDAETPPGAMTADRLQKVFEACRDRDAGT